MAQPRTAVEGGARKVSIAATMVGDLATVLEVAKDSEVQSAKTAVRQAAQGLRRLGAKLSTIAGVGISVIGTTADIVAAAERGDKDAMWSAVKSLAPQIGMSLFLPTAVLNALLSTIAGNDWPVKAVRGFFRPFRRMLNPNREIKAALRRQQRYDLGKSTAGQPDKRYPGLHQPRTPMINRKDLFHYLFNQLIYLRKRGWRGARIIQDLRSLTRIYRLDYDRDLPGDQKVLLMQLAAIK